MKTNVKGITLIVKRNIKTNEISGAAWRVSLHEKAQSKDFRIDIGNYEISWQEALDFYYSAKGIRGDLAPPMEIPSFLKDYFEERINSTCFNKRHALPLGINLEPSTPGATNYYWKACFSDKKTGKQVLKKISINKYGYETAWNAAIKIRSENSGEDLNSYLNNPPNCPEFLLKLSPSETVDLGVVNTDMSYEKTGISIVKKGIHTHFSVRLNSLDSSELKSMHRSFSIISYGYEGAWKLARELAISVKSGFDIPTEPPPLTKILDKYIDDVKHSITFIGNKKTKTAGFIFAGSDGIKTFNIHKYGYENTWKEARSFLIKLGRDGSRIPVTPPPRPKLLLEIIDIKNKETLQTKAILKNKI